MEFVGYSAGTYSWFGRLTLPQVPEDHTAISGEYQKEFQPSLQPHHAWYVRILGWSSNTSPNEPADCREKHQPLCLKAFRPKEEKKREGKKLLDSWLALAGSSWELLVPGGTKAACSDCRAWQWLDFNVATSLCDPKITVKSASCKTWIKIRFDDCAITHRDANHKWCCVNRAAAMQDGQLIEEGSVLDIFLNPNQDGRKTSQATATGNFTKPRLKSKARKSAESGSK